MISTGNAVRVCIVTCMMGTRRNVVNRSQVIVNGGGVPVDKVTVFKSANVLGRKRGS